MTATSAAIMKDDEQKFGFCYSSPSSFGSELNPYGLTVDEEELVNLADDMASSMSDLNSHNYKSFVETRDRFRAKIKSMGEKIRASEERLARMKKAIAEM